MKKLNYYEATTEDNQTSLEFEIPFYSEIKEITYIDRRCSPPIFQALVLEDLSEKEKQISYFSHLGYNPGNKFILFERVGINQELDDSFSDDVVKVSRISYDGVKLDDIYLIRKNCKNANNNKTDPTRH
jgi:hypothetical protein